MRRHPIACFVVITYAVSWTAWLSAGGVITAGFSPLSMLALAGPLVGAVVTSALTPGGLRDLAMRLTRIPAARWWLLAIGAPLALAWPVLPWVPADAFTHFTGFPIVRPIALWLLLVVVNGIGEETGWRGYLLPLLERRFPQRTANLIVGAIWAAWHTPAFFVCATYRAMPLAMLPVFVLGIFAGALVLGWLFERSGRSILVAAAFHGTYNLVSATAGGTLATIETAAVMVAAVAVARAMNRRRS